MAVKLKLIGGDTVVTERQHLLVLNAGRLCTIDLLVLPETLSQSRDVAYAVCVSVRFVVSCDNDSFTSSPLTLRYSAVCSG
jgi:hypothetical protein